VHQYVRVRAARPALVALIGVAAVLLAAAPALAATGPTLRLSASHGRAGDSVTATFSYPNSWGWFGPTCNGPVTFRWDGRSVAQPHPGQSGGSCSASVTITPQSGTSGSHTVNGSAPNMGSAEARYTIDPEPTPLASTPAPPPSPPPSLSATAGSVRITSTAQSAQPSQSGRSAQPSQSARPTPSASSPSPSAAAVPDLSGGAAAGDPPTLVAMDAPAVIVRPAASTPLGVWVLMAGGALILLGAVLVGAVRVFRRKKRVAFSL
jgi:hypothetical protein